jgi:hypothetical protein
VALMTDSPVLVVGAGPTGLVMASPSRRIPQGTVAVPGNHQGIRSLDVKLAKAITK